MSKVIEAHAMRQGGLIRQFFYSGGKGARHLVVLLHGSSGWAKGYLQNNGWLNASDEYALLAPQGLCLHPKAPAHFEHNPQVWNSGHIEGTPRARFDDVAFIEDCVRWMQERFDLDGALFVAGHSMGGTMGIRLANERPGWIDALYVCAGHWPQPHKLPRADLRPDFIYVTGEADPLNPFDGGVVEMPWITFQADPVPAYIEAWTGASRAPSMCTMEGVVLQQWICAGGRLVQMIRIKGHGHAWPRGQESGVSPAMLGPVAAHFDATAHALALFSERLRIRPPLAARGLDPLPSRSA